MSTHIDIIDGSRARKNREGWQEVERIATVTGLTSTGQDQFDDALSASGMPSMGAAHPSLTGLYLDEANLSALGPGKVQASLIYRRIQLTDYPLGGIPIGEAATMLEVGTTVQQVESNIDSDGLSTTLTYTGNDKPPGDPQEQVARFPRMVPQTTLIVKRREVGNPLSKSKLYVGKINRLPWAADPDALPYSWLCTGIIGTSSDGNQTYDVTYTFQHCGDSPTGTWFAKCKWVGSNGQIPTDLVDNTGIKSIQVYDSIDFNLLNL